MITGALADVVAWFIETALAFLGFAIPVSVLSMASEGLGVLATMFSFGPAGIVGICLVAYLAIDTALNGFVFAISVYRLIPFKAS